MKEQVTDISKVLLNIAEEMRLMRETINQQHTEITKLNRNIESLNHQLRKKNEEIAELKKLLSKYETPDKNSGNSSMPPGKERMKDEIVRRTKTLRKPSGKKPGGQEGHKGHKLSCVDTPDEVIDDVPDYCTNCGETLADAERILDYVTQKVSIPELKPVVKEIRHYVMVCKNCGERIRTAPRHRSNDVVYDASVKSLVVYLSVVQFLPYGRIANFLHDVLGLSPSEGSLVNWVNEAKRNAQPIVDKIKEYIMSSNVVGFDESGCYCNKRLDWAWIAQTVYYTLLFRANGRGSKELTDRFGDSLERMTTVTDRHSAYFALHFLNHQVCLAHLLRELQYLSELNTSQKWSEQVANLFREAIHKRNTNPTDIISKASWLDKLDCLLKLNVSKFGKKFDTFKIGLIKCRDYIFNFLEDPVIPPDNNASERGIRKLKIKLKNSCTFRSDFGADAFLELHSVVETAKKHNQTPFNAIQALFEV
ncbi:IS66 family transposase [Prevotella pectinovora]|uniref:IS66 family transposase n=1 Tax=Prevotella pectinovora TaxID=1602169 RepID=UPI0005C76E1D|nr:IS66 family transposase [Prevotella pectinovora]